MRSHCVIQCALRETETAMGNDQSSERAEHAQEVAALMHIAVALQSYGTHYNMVMRHCPGKRFAPSSASTALCDYHRMMAKAYRDVMYQVVDPEVQQPRQGICRFNEETAKLLRDSLDGDFSGATPTSIARRDTAQ